MTAETINAICGTIIVAITLGSITAMVCIGIWKK